MTVLTNCIRWFVTHLLRLLCWTFYRIDVKGHENLPKGGGLVTANHATFVDAFFLGLSCLPRLVHYAIYEGFYKNRWMAPGLKLYGALPVTKTKAKTALKTMAKGAKEGHLVGIFPEGQLSRGGIPMRLQKGYLLIARNSGCPVIPIYLGHLRGSWFSYEEDREMRMKPRAWRDRITVDIGEPLPPDEAGPQVLKMAWYGLSAQALERHPDVAKPSLQRSIIRGLSHDSWRPLLASATPSGRRSLRRGEALSIALPLARRLHNTLPEGRIGILLPPGSPRLLGRLALALAGRIPVDLPAELDVESARTAELHAVVSTSSVFAQNPAMAQLANGNIIDLAAEISAIPGWSVPLAATLRRLLPAGGTLAAFGLPNVGEGAVGAISDGVYYETPAGRVLANVEQIANTSLIGDEDRLMCAPGWAEPGGPVLSFWFPVLRRGGIITVRGDVDDAALGAVAQDEGATLYLGTEQPPHEVTGLRAWIAPGEQGAVPPHFSAETPDEDQAAAEIACPALVRAQDGIVIGLSTPDPDLPETCGELEFGRCEGSWGRLLTGFGVIETLDNNLEVWGPAFSGSESLHATLDEFGFIIPHGGGEPPEEEE